MRRRHMLRFDRLLKSWGKEDDDADVEADETSTSAQLNVGRLDV